MAIGMFREGSDRLPPPPAYRTGSLRKVPTGRLRQGDLASSPELARAARPTPWRVATCAPSPRAVGGCLLVHRAMTRGDERRKPCPTSSHHAAIASLWQPSHAKYARYGWSIAYAVGDANYCARCVVAAANEARRTALGHVFGRIGRVPGHGYYRQGRRSERQRRLGGRREYGGCWRLGTSYSHTRLACFTHREAPAEHG